jgi:tripartite-type tricarboxylate transporter receptor subunit TctC
MTLKFALFRTATALALLIAGATVELASAADSAYPSRPIRVVVATAAGGGVDAVARIIAPRLSESMGQTWIVDNRAGAGGNVGAEIVARANPDGYTALACTSTLLTVNPSLYKMSFSMQRDLQPVTVLAAGEQVVVVHPAVPAKTLQELIALAKKKPGALNYASAGVGTAIHLGAELLNMRAGIDMKQVPYKGGGPAAAAVLSGEVQVLVGTVASTIPFVQAGRLRALATTGAKRSKLLPDLPTVAESGYPGFEAGLWFALLVPAATPKNIAERMRSETAKVLQQPDVQAAMARQGLEPESSTPAELAARITTESATWAALIKKLAIRVE